MKKEITISSQDAKKLAKENRLIFYSTNNINTFIHTRVFYILNENIYLIGVNDRDYKIAKIIK
jgi:hypothetical protein